MNDGAEQLPDVFTHYGWLWFVPVLVGNVDSSEPCITVRWWVPEFVLDLAEAMFHTVNANNIDPLIPIKITGEIKKK